MPASDPINPAAPIVASGLRKNTYSNDELLACGRGELFGPGNEELLIAADSFVLDFLTELFKLFDRTCIK